MRKTIDLLASVYSSVDQGVRAQGVAIEELVTRTSERQSDLRPQASAHGSRVTLPLLRSKEPGTLNLVNFDFDNISLPDVKIWIALTSNRHIRYMLAAKRVDMLARVACANAMQIIVRKEQGQ